MTKHAKAVDIRIDGGTAGFYQILADTARARRWCRRHVENFGDTIVYCDDSRLTQDIADRLVRAGFRVLVNGNDYR